MADESATSATNKEGNEEETGQTLGARTTGPGYPPKPSGFDFCAPYRDRSGEIFAIKLLMSLSLRSIARQ